MDTPSILINNAAYWAPSYYRTFDAEVIDHHCSVNIRGTGLLTTKFAHRFEQAHVGKIPGRIIFMVSKGNDANNLAYLATKGAQTTLIEPLSVGLPPLGITVSAVDPGPTDSGWMDDVNNWQYAEKIPTSPWRGAMTIPRQLTLREISEMGYIIVQNPVQELKKIRGETYKFHKKIYH